MLSLFNLELIFRNQLEVTQLRLAYCSNYFS